MTAPSLISRAHRLVRDDGLWRRGAHVLCATSGGPDSMAMLHALILLRKRLGHRLSAVGIDHGLRSEASKELALVRQLADEHDVPFSKVRLRVARGSNLQARAREARHAALQRAAARHDADLIALGHTADDRAETVIMRILRGAGPRGVGAMPSVAGAPTRSGVSLVRPLLTARRADVIDHLERHEMAYAEDPSNRDARFLRVRVRHEVLPLLEELSPGIVAHLCALADMLHTSSGDDPLASLNRAQRLSVERARKLGRKKTTVRVSGGRDLEVVFLGETPVLRTHK